jgi:hypothetical protein
METLRAHARIPSHWLRGSMWQTQSLRHVGGCEVIFARGLLSSARRKREAACGPGRCWLDDNLFSGA